MRIFHPLCALVLAAAAPAALLAQDSAPSGAAPTTTAAAKKEPVKKKPVKRAGPPAKELFGAAKSPAPMAARAIGFYAKGCLAGAAALPIDGAGLAGHAPLAQPQLGPSQARRPGREARASRPRRTTAGRGCWSATSPSPAAGRC